MQAYSCHHKCAKDDNTGFYNDYDHLQLPENGGSVVCDEEFLQMVDDHFVHTWENLSILPSTVSPKIFSLQREKVYDLPLGPYAVLVVCASSLQAWIFL